MKTYTINISGGERHDGEKPYTYALEADDIDAAKYAAWIFHLWQVEAGEGTVPPHMSEGHDGSDVVVIDCEEFPCHAGTPFKCADRYHRADLATGHREPPEACTCAFNWSWIYLKDSGGPTLREAERELEALGYVKHAATPPEETTW